MPPSNPPIWVELDRGLAERTLGRFPGDDAPLLSDDQRDFAAALRAALHQPTPDPSKAQELGERLRSEAYEIRDAGYPRHADLLDQAAALLTALSEVPNEEESWACDSCGAISPIETALGWEQTGPDDAGVTVERCPACRLAFLRSLASRAPSSGGQLAEDYAAGVASGSCPHCEGGMDAMGGVHLKSCPLADFDPDTEQRGRCEAVLRGAIAEAFECLRGKHGNPRVTHARDILAAALTSEQSEGPRCECESGSSEEGDWHEAGCPLFAYAVDLSEQSKGDQG